MSTTVIKKICSVCGSADVIRDAIVAWSEPAQAWELVSVLDNGDCNACGNSGNSAIEDVEVDAITIHDSDCATHNEPAQPNGQCDCGFETRLIAKRSLLGR